MGFHFEGGSELARNLDLLPDRVSRRVQRDALLAGAAPVRQQARATAPRAPGAPDIADNIGASTALGPNGEPAVAVGPVVGFHYGIWLEEGNSRQGAQPFMRPSLDSETTRALKVIGEHLWDAIRSRGFALSSSKTSSGPVLGGPGGAGIL